MFLVISVANCQMLINDLCIWNNITMLLTLYFVAGLYFCLAAAGNMLNMLVNSCASYGLYNNLLKEKRKIASRQDVV